MEKEKEENKNKKTSGLARTCTWFIQNQVLSRAAHKSKNMSVDVPFIFQYAGSRVGMLWE